MIRSRLFWKVFGSTVLLVALTAAVVDWLVATEAMKDAEQSFDDQLETRLVLLRELAGPALKNPAARDTLQADVRRLGQELRSRLTVVAPDGDVLADSDADPATMDNHGDRPEIAAARTGTVGSSSRESGTVKELLRYRAVAVRSGKDVVGFVRVAAREAVIAEAGAEAHREVLQGALIAVLLALVAGFFPARSIARTEDEAKTREASARAQVESLLENIREAVTHMTRVTGQILSATTEQATSTQEQAAAVSETASTADELTQSTQQVAERARGVGESARRTVEIGEEGKNAVQTTVSAMIGLREQVQTTAATILSLAERAQAIGEIISSVNDIAEQTNLLSLNAAIEASRAGEHGKGFAVVAAEVKELAGQSKQATHQVREILGEIQKATNGAVLSIEAVTKGVSSASDVTTRAGDVIGTLVETLGDMMRATSQIAAAAGQQASAVGQITQAVRNIDQAAQQNLIATRHSEEVARDLADLASRLSEMAGTSTGNGREPGLPPPSLPFGPRGPAASQRLVGVSA